MDKRLQKYFIEGGIRMKMSFKANLDVEFEVKTKKEVLDKRNFEMVFINYY